MNKIVASMGFALSALGLALPLSALAQTSSSASNCVVLTVDMTIGSTDATTAGQVSILQSFLQKRGVLELKPGTGLGTFGTQTRSAVASFQRNNGIISTGYVGPLTRENIKTISCAIGSQDTSTLPTTVIPSGMQNLLTFTSPVPGDLVIKNEKDLNIDWALSPLVESTFPKGTSYLMLDLVGSDGAVVSSVGNGTKVSQRGQGHRVENDFKKALKGRRDNVIPTGQYKIKATLQYRPTASTTAEQALASTAATFAAESGWFSVVDPAPKPVIRFSAALTNILTSQPVELTWSATASSTDCTFTDVMANATTSIGTMGTTTVTPTQTSVYKVACNLTSVWPFPGMSYTTSAQRGVTITYGPVTSAAPVTTTPPAATPTFHNILAGTQSVCEDEVRAAHGSLVTPCSIGGGCALRGGIPSATNPSANPRVWGACIETTPSDSSSTIAPAPEDDSSSDTRKVRASKPEITVTVNGTLIDHSGTVSAPSGTMTLEWTSVGAETCYLNGSEIETSGAQTLSGVTNGSYKFVCSNSSGQTSVSFKATDKEKKVKATRSAVLGSSTSIMCLNLPYNFHRGSESQMVSDLQNFLIATGFLGGEATGFYGDKTVAAVRAYQASKGLPKTGMVYSFTRAALTAETCN